MAFALIGLVGAVLWFISATLEWRGLSQLEGSPPTSLQPELFEQVKGNLKKTILSDYSIGVGLLIMGASVGSLDVLFLGGIILFGSVVTSYYFKNKARKCIGDAEVDINILKQGFDDIIKNGLLLWTAKEVKSKELDSANYISLSNDCSDGKNGNYVPKIINGKYGYVNAMGNIVIIPLYDEAWEFNEELAAVKMNGKIGYIDNKGKMIINALFDDGWSFSEGLAVVKIGNKFGYIDKSGSVVFEFKFDEAFDFIDGVAEVREGDKVYNINK